MLHKNVTFLYLKCQQFPANSGFDFLLECWNDDPALQIVIKKLVAKFPQWGIGCVDGVLVDWEE
ncbi:hypothetical protein F8S12_34660 [Nostoc sp. WHI]|nr:hypothetical protein [Nostoc sp. WHI]